MGPTGPRPATTSSTASSSPTPWPPSCSASSASAAEAAAKAEIAADTGVNYSTIITILHSRIYLGEVLLNGDWFPGHHSPIITPEEFAAAHRGRIKGRRRGKDLLSGKVRCGLCHRVMCSETNGEGRLLYRCRHRGGGCNQPRRTNTGLLRAALLGLELLAGNQALQAAIRAQLDAATTTPQSGKRQRTRDADKLTAQRRKLLQLYYDDKITADLFADEQERLAQAIHAAETDAAHDAEQQRVATDLIAVFDRVAALAELDITRVWDAATHDERRILLDELLDHVAVHPDHLEVKVHGAPTLNVLLSEVGLAESQISGVGGGTRRLSTSKRRFSEEVPLAA